MKGPLMSEQNIKVVTDVFTAINEKRWQDVAASYSPQAVIDYPQSGERIEGRDQIQGMLEAFPVPPTFVVRNAFGGADQSVIVEFDAVYAGADPWKGVALYWLSAAGIDREVAYFGEPFDPPEWRVSHTG